MTPTRIQISRQHPWRSQHPDAVIVDRTTRYGNPFRIGHRHEVRLRDGSTRQMVISGPRAAIEAHVLWLRGEIDLPDVERPSLTSIVEELGGRDLGCWCGPEQPCHADTLITVANPVEGYDPTTGILTITANVADFAFDPAVIGGIPSPQGVTHG